MTVALAPWFVPLRAVTEQTRLRIFMFPFAGAGPAALRDYAQAWPEGMVPFAAQLPGRERRIKEPPLHSATDAADGFASALAAAADRPFVLFGHSLGAVLAFETARVLLARGGPLPQHLVVSGFSLARPRDDAFHRRTDADFIAGLTELGGTSAEILSHPALMAMLLPTLRADFEIAETFVPRQGPRLRCPITALAGSQDTTASPADMAAWANETVGSCTTHALAGNHFFIAERVNEIVDIVCGATGHFARSVYAS